MGKRKVLFLSAGIMLAAAACGTDENKQGLEISGDVEFGESDYEEIVSANNQLGMELLAQIEPDEEGNTFISPLSLFMALSMAYNGADGDTKEEIAGVLQKEGIEVEELNKANASMMMMLHSEAEEIQLSVGNSIWLNEDFTFQEEFAQHSQDYFNAEIQEINVEDDGSVDTINNWVSVATNGKIEGIVEAPLNPLTVAILINAIYFKGDWQYPFEEDDTESGIFQLQDGTEEEVQLMAMTENLPYMENSSFQAVSLPYGEGEMSMNVFLPSESSSLEEFSSSLTAEKLEEWRAGFSEQRISLKLPTFQLEYESELKESLELLGMESAFYDGANFSRLIQEDNPVKISSVLQKTFIDVSEEGTEAAAATSVTFLETSGPAEPILMEVDRPFFFTITEEESGTVLFMGSIAHPQEGD